MGKIRRTIHIVAALICVALPLIIGGCNNSSCMENRSSIPLAKFYASHSHNAITVDSLAIGGVDAPDDSLLVDNVRTSQVYLPLRSTKSSTAFYIRYLQKQLDFPRLYDTITLAYESMPYFASYDCGAMYRYRIQKMEYTRHLIDSVAVTDSLVTNLDRETLKIFFRTEEPSEPEE